MTMNKKLLGVDVLYLIYATALIAFSSYVIFSMPGLRPIADDYCHAVAGSNGLISYFNTFYFSWNSDFLALIINFFILGWPLATLPYSIASMVTLLFSILCVNFLIFVLIFQTLKIRTYFKILPIIFLSYLGFWLTSKVFSQNSNFIDLSNMIVHWQTVNGYYVVLSSLLLSVLVYLLNRENTFRGNLKSIFLIGLLSGTLGILLTSIILVFNLMYLLYLFISNSMLVFKRLSVFTLGLIFGAFLTVISPGNRARSDLLNSAGITQKLDPVFLFNWTFPYSLFEWLQGLMHPGSLIALSFGFILGMLINKFGISLSLDKLLHNFIIIFTLSIVATTLSQLSEAFSYEAFWHLVIPYLLIYFMCIVFGVILGMVLNSAFITLTLLVMFMVLSLSISFLNVSQLSKDISSRKFAWKSGPASFNYIGDIEDKQGWIYSCWNDMKEIKGYPER